MYGMDVEKTMQFLIESAPQHDARLAEIETNNVLIQRAVFGKLRSKPIEDCGRPTEDSGSWARSSTAASAN
jgi:hypothetical protein